MAWLAQLDTRAQHWPPAGRWMYVAVKWTLIALGAFALGGVLLDRSGLWSMYH
jgi:hypothetical protein